MRCAGVAAVSITYTNVSNPAAFGVQWVARGDRYALVKPRGTAALLVGVKRDGRWSHPEVIDPSRFGLNNVQVDLDLVGGVQVTEDRAEPVNPDDEPATGPGSQR